MRNVWTYNALAISCRLKSLIIQLSVLLSVGYGCMGSTLSTLLGSDIRQLDRRHLTVNDYLNATVSAYGSGTCDQTRITAFTPLHKRTLCPWEYSHNVDMDRFPSVITMAKCKCQKCLASENYLCVPIFYAIDVLKKNYTREEVNWFRKSELVSVACTCVKPHLHEMPHSPIEEILSQRKRIPQTKNIFSDILQDIPAIMMDHFQADFF